MGTTLPGESLQDLLYPFAANTDLRVSCIRPCLCKCLIDVRGSLIFNRQEREKYEITFPADPFCGSGIQHEVVEKCGPVAGQIESSDRLSERWGWVFTGPLSSRYSLFWVTWLPIVGNSEPLRFLLGEAERCWYAINRRANERRWTYACSLCRRYSG
jgi:hypothetical protein